MRFRAAEFRDLWASLKTPIADELADELRNGSSSLATYGFVPVS